MKVSFLCNKCCESRNTCRMKHVQKQKKENSSENNSSNLKTKKTRLKTESRKLVKNIELTVR